MENAAEALKMAAAVLIFVLALSITINSFTETRIAATTILEYKDREYNFDYVEDNGTTARIVGLESIVPTIYKAYKENYKIVFDSSVLEDGVYQKIDETGKPQPINYIDLQKEVLGSDTQKEQFIKALLYGKKYKSSKDDPSNFKIVKDTFEKNFKIILNEIGLYDRIRNIKLKESIGIYYLEEVNDTQENDTNSNVPDANKTEKRVITYTKPKP